MSHKNHTDSLQSKASSELQETSPDASKDDALQAAIAPTRGLTFEQLEEVVRERGLENDPEVIRSLECIRQGVEVEALRNAISENRDPTIEEVEAAVREVGLENDPESVRHLENLRDSEKIIKASELMIEAYALLRDLQKRGGEMEIEAVQGFLEMAELAVDGLGECSEEATVSVAEKKTSWPVMMEGSGKTALETAQAEFERIKLGSRNSSEVKISAVVTAASRHKFVATLLYWTVRAIFNLNRLSRSVENEPIRMERLENDLAVKYKMLMQLVNGFEANDWREEDRQELGKKLKALRACPDVNTASFKEWFGACLALLDCITQSQFYLPHYKLRNLGEARAQNREGTEGRKDSHYRDGITGALKSALKTVLKINRKKEG
jgi:hypothetical protein